MSSDPNDQRFLDLIQPWNKQQGPGYCILGVPFDRATIGRRGAQEGPDAIRANFRYYSTYDWDWDFEMRPQIFDWGNLDLTARTIIENLAIISKAIKKIRSHKLIPVVLGGDNSITYATVKGITNNKTIGVINFDAHLDLRSTSNQITSGNPFRKLIEDGVLKNGSHLVEIGIQNFKNSKIYRKYAEEQGVRVFSLTEIRKKGVQNIVEDTLTHFDSTIEELYVSVDIDVLDQGLSPGVSAQTTYGMTSWEIADAIRVLALDSRIIGLDIVETSPTYDKLNQTSNIAAYLVVQFIATMEFSKSVK